MESSLFYLMPRSYIISRLEFFIGHIRWDCSNWTLFNMVAQADPNPVKSLLDSALAMLLLVTRFWGQFKSVEGLCWHLHSNVYFLNPWLLISMLTIGHAVVCHRWSPLRLQSLPLGTKLGVNDIGCVVPSTWDSDWIGTRWYLEARCGLLECCLREEKLLLAIWIFLLHSVHLTGSISVLMLRSFCQLNPVRQVEVNWLLGGALIRHWGHVLAFELGLFGVEVKVVLVAFALD